MFRVGGEGDQAPPGTTLGDGRTLANWSAPAPRLSAAPAPPAPPAKTPPEERELLTIKQLVEYSTLSERTLRSYLKRRSQPLPHYRVDKKILIRRSEFDEWLANFRMPNGGTRSPRRSMKCSVA